MAAFPVSAQKARQLQPRNRLKQDYVQQSVIHAGIRRRAVTAAIHLRIADRQHHIYAFLLALIRPNPQPVPEGAAHRFQYRKRIGRCTAAQRHAPPFCDAIGDLRIDPGRVDVDAIPLWGTDEICLPAFRRQLCVQVQKIRLRTEITHIVVSAAAGNAANGNLFFSRSGLQHLVHGAVTAAGVNADFLPALRAGFGDFPGMAGVPRYTDRRFDPRARRRGAYTRHQADACIHFTGRRIDDKEIAYPRLPPSPSGKGSIYCNFFREKVQEGGINC